ncbi:MAG: type III PLP-dependent enzyme [Pseudomonadota bacterium]
MSRQPAIWPAPEHFLRMERPDHPVLFFSPKVLRATAARFRAGFPGLVTYAVKANDAIEVIENLVGAGLTAFDVASPQEMERVRTALRGAVLHYNNPVRSPAELEIARRMGVASYALDDRGELEKLMAAGLPDGIEVAVRLRLPIKGAAYDFGAKFGADPAHCAELLRAAVAAGFIPSMTFHPGTQCADPAAWRAYIFEAANVARVAGVRLNRLNVGGGFAAHRGGPMPDLEAIFSEIAGAVSAAFGHGAPKLVCEPGRAMVADAFTLATRIKALREDGSVFLNDGIYGGFAEAPILGNVARMRVISPEGSVRQGPVQPRIVFGPTCDSLDRLPDTLPMPADTTAGDYVLFEGMGAYSTATVTRFNGYGGIVRVTVHGLA